MIREKAQSPAGTSEESESEDTDSDGGLNFWEKYIELQVDCPF